MNILKALLLTCLGLVSTTAFAQSRTSPSSQPVQTAANATFDPQTGYIVPCKGLQVPEGFVVPNEVSRRPNFGVR